MSEKAYKVMSHAGTSSIVIGIIMVVVGITTGTISIVTGAHLLKHKADLTF